MRIESLAYFLFGNNLIIGPHIRKQLKFLKGIIPPAFQHREMDDLGCGDGKVTLLLKEIFLPKSVRGFDVDQRLVRRASSRGIEAEARNLDDNMPSGELAVLWRVLHHLKDKGDCLKRMKENYDLIFIGEPVKSGMAKGLELLELGHPLKKEEFEYLLQEHLADCQTIYYGNNVFTFYVSPKM